MDSLQVAFPEVLHFPQIRDSSHSPVTPRNLACSSNIIWWLWEIKGMKPPRMGGLSFLSLSITEHYHSYKISQYSFGKMDSTVMEPSTMFPILLVFVDRNFHDLTNLLAALCDKWNKKYIKKCTKIEKKYQNTS